MAKDKASRFTLKEKSWILYDWANSVYATNIMAAIFPTIFVSMAGSSGDYWWSIGTSVTTLLVALLSPFLGALADFDEAERLPVAEMPELEQYMLVLLGQLDATLRQAVDAFGGWQGA